VSNLATVFSFVNIFFVKRKNPPVQVSEEISFAPPVQKKFMSHAFAPKPTRQKKFRKRLTKELTQKGGWTILLNSNLGGLTMKPFIKVMKALSDPNRVKIIKMLQQRVLCVCELKAALNLAQPTVSKHLKLLEDAGLVESDKDGLWVNYRLTNGNSSPYAATLLGNLRHWLNEDTQITDLIEKLPSIRREDVCKR
jgi:ArsR family transcriptional regulator, arsenate/arsenite/antimonite-responsive transcriptional repressor